MKRIRREAARQGLEFELGREVAFMIYHANATRDDRFRLVHVPEVDRHTQARTVDEIEVMARDLIAIMTGVDA